MTENHWRSMFRQELRHLPSALRLVNPPLQPVEDFAKQDRHGLEYGDDGRFETLACLDGGISQTGRRRILRLRLRQSAGSRSSVGRHDDSSPRDIDSYRQNRYSAGYAAMTHPASTI